MNILQDIWKSMPTQKILQTTSFNMVLINKEDAGYKWSSVLNLSIQYKNAKYTMVEILNMIKVNGYSMKISIKLETEQIIKYKIN